MRTKLLLLALLASLSVPSIVVAQGLPAVTATPSVNAILAPLRVGPDDLLLTGERSKRTIVVVAQPEELAGNASLFLKLQSAISVAPEWSEVTVALNDQELGKARLHSGDAYTMQFPLPAGVLQPGYNALTITVDQAHRVDCSVAATYELWTRIDPGQSGFVFEGARKAAPDFTSLLAAAGAMNGTTPIRGLTDDLSGELSNRLLEAFQTLAIGASIERPDVDFSPVPGTGQGIDVVTGSRDEVARRLGALTADVTLADGVNIGRRADGRLVVALVAASEPEFANALAALRQGLSNAATGSPAGLAALKARKGVDVDAHGELTFAQLGISDEDFSGRLYKQSSRFVLPADFYPADYAPAQINLDALYAAGLAPGAALQFKINGQVVSTLKLSGSRVGEASDRRLPVSLSAFRPGTNELEIEAQLPAQIDTDCAPGTTSDNGRRLKLAGTSVLQLPTLARVGRFPDLGAIDTSVMGRDPSMPLNIVTPRGDAAELHVAATMLTRLAYSSGHVVATTLSTSPTLTENAPLLVVGALADLPGDLAASLPIDLGAAPATPEQSNAAANGAVSLISGFAPAGSLQAHLSLDDLKSTVYGLGLTAGVKIDALRDTRITPIAPLAGTGLMVSQTLNAAGTAPITIVTASTPQLLADTLPELVSPSGWSQLGGSAVTLASTGERLQAIDSRLVQYYPAGDVSFNNLRLVAAGWMSNSPSVYVLLLLAFALLLGVSTHWLLSVSRSKGK